MPHGTYFTWHGIRFRSGFSADAYVGERSQMIPYVIYARIFHVITHVT